MITPKDIKNECKINDSFSREVEELLDKTLKNNMWDVKPFAIVTFYYEGDIQLRLINEILEKYKNACWKIEELNSGDCRVNHIFYRDTKDI